MIKVQISEKLKPMFAIAVLLLFNYAQPAISHEDDYTLLCKKEAIWSRSSEKPRTMAASVPLIAKVRFTGKQTRVRDPDPNNEGQFTAYNDLNIELNGQVLPGGAINGSTYDASTTYDDAFKRTGLGSTQWAYSRGLSAWTLSFNGKDYLCTKK